MRTPKEFIDNLNNKIITAEMLGLAAYSVNKRAKNCRDKERSYRGCKYNYSDTYREKKEEYYHQKDTLLTVVKPDRIHIAKQPHRVRYYDYEYEYDCYHENDILKSGCFYDHDLNRTVDFIDVYEYDRLHFLFYQVGDYSFHHPIDKSDITKYPDLEVVDIGDLETFGKEIAGLVSCQFVDKVIALIKSNDYQYVA